jgi:putative transposase
MKKLKAYKFRLYPNKTQTVLLEKTFGCVRYFWNNQVDTFNSFNKETNPNPTFLTSTQLRNQLDWMKEVSASAIQQKEIDFKEFKNQFFSNKRKSKIGKPSFKKKSNVQSYRLPNQKFKVLKNRVQLEKIGKVKFVQDREFPKEYRFISITISKNASGQYFCSMLLEQEIEHKNLTSKEVGIDVGIKSFSTQSDEIVIDNPKFFNKSQVELKRLQQHFSRKTKSSKRANKCRLKIAKLYQKINNQRSHFLHNYSTRLVTNYDKIFIEDLGVKSLIESKTLSKEISDVSWSTFFKMLEYKCNWYGKEVIKVNRYYASSKTCSCGVKNDNLKLSDRTWKCSSCGAINNRDLLASQNILKEGRRNLGDLTDVESNQCVE